MKPKAKLAICKCFGFDRGGHSNIIVLRDLAGGIVISCSSSNCPFTPLLQKKAHGFSRGMNFACTEKFS
jgi:hypothetical protein